VHQRFALQYLGDSDESARQAVARLVNLVKPGIGWIQLGEAHLVGWAEGGNVDLPALRRGKQMTEDFCAKLNINTNSLQSLGRWLKEAAAVDVEVKEFATNGWEDGVRAEGAEESAGVPCEAESCHE
jgi:hypothetical protein